MLKFGQVIDVGMLDSIGMRNKSADELREALKGQVRRWSWWRLGAQHVSSVSCPEEWSAALAVTELDLLLCQLGA